VVLDRFAVWSKGFGTTLLTVLSNLVLLVVIFYAFIKEHSPVFHVPISDRSR